MKSERRLMFRMDPSRKHEILAMRTAPAAHICTYVHNLGDNISNASVLNTDAVELFVAADTLPGLEIMSLRDGTILK